MGQNSSALRRGIRYQVYIYTLNILMLVFGVYLQMHEFTMSLASTSLKHFL